MKKRDILLILTFSAALLRVVISFLICVIFKDGVSYIAMAKALKESDYSTFFSYPYHPLYSVLIYFLNKLGLGWEISAKIISISSGSLSVIPFYLLSEKLFERKIAILASIIFIFHPLLSVFSADIMSESLYIFFLILALYYSYLALSELKIKYFAFTGIFAGFAYLTRPEGVIVIIITLILLILFYFKKLKNRMKIIAISCIVLILSFFSLSFPYVFLIHKNLNIWTFTQKKSILTLSGIEKSGKLNIINPHFYNFWKTPPKKIKFSKIMLIFLNKIAKNIYFPIFLLILYTLVKFREEIFKSKNHIFILVFWIFYLIILFRLFQVCHYVSGRHIVAGSVLTFLWAALALVNLSRDKDKILKILIFIIIISCLPKSLKFHRKDKIILKEIGLWIKENYKENLKICTTHMPRIAFYASGDHFELPRHNWEDFIKKYKIDILVINKRKLKEFSLKFPKELEKNLVKKILKVDSIEIYKVKL